MELTRKQVINSLETLKLEWGELAPPEDNICDALEYAISSLKTDEAYQLMYEREKIYTKADMVAMLTEIQMEIDEQWEITWKSDYKGGYKDGCVKANEIIQQKIDNLTEDKK